MPKLVMQYDEPSPYITVARELRRVQAELEKVKDARTKDRAAMQRVHDELEEKAQSLWADASLSDEQAHEFDELLVELGARLMA